MCEREVGVCVLSAQRWIPLHKSPCAPMWRVRLLFRRMLCFSDSYRVLCFLREPGAVGGVCARWKAEAPVLRALLSNNKQLPVSCSLGGFCRWTPTEHLVLSVCCVAAVSSPCSTTSP